MWVIAAGLVLFLPQKDLLGFLKKKDQQQEHARQVQLAQRDIEQTTSTVRLVVKQLGNPELNAELAKLAEMPKGAKPEIAKRQAIRKLGDIGDKLKKMQSGVQLGSIELMRQMLRQLRGTPNAFSQKLRLALAQGNFAGASSLLKQYQEQLAEGKLSDEQRKALTQQLQNLARQLQELAEKNEQLEAELEKLGLEKKLAKLSEEQLRKVLQQQGLSAEKIEQFLQKMASCRSACSRCSGIGNAMGACGIGAGGLSGDELASVIEQLDELEAFRQQMMLTQASLDEIGRAIGCLGQGLCQGLGCQGPFREGLAQKYGPGTGGPGRGYGPRSIDEDGQTSTKKTRVKSKSEQGPVIASWYFKGTQVKGQAKRDFSEVIQAGRDSAAEAISENQIPRKYEESVKKYFGQLEQSGGE
jgi:truncated hemoglobin YjbI